MSVSVRRATQADVPFLAALVQHAEVAPYLAAVRASSEDEVRAEVDHSERDPDAFGVIVIEADGTPVGTVTWERANRRSRIASIGGFAIAPEHRGMSVGTEAARALQRRLVRNAGFHRLQMEVYGFNERALRHAERTGLDPRGRSPQGLSASTTLSVDEHPVRARRGGPWTARGIGRGARTPAPRRGGPAQADVAGLVVDLAGEEQHAGLRGEALAERLRVVARAGAGSRSVTRSGAPTRRARRGASTNASASARFRARARGSARRARSRWRSASAASSSLGALEQIVV